MSGVESVGPEALVRRTRVKRFCWQVSETGWENEGGVGVGLPVGWEVAMVVLARWVRG